VNKEQSNNKKTALLKSMNSKLNSNTHLNPRITWYSNAPWAATGYGTQSSQVLKRLKKNNYDVAVIANYGLEAASTSWNTEYGSIPVYPRGIEHWSNDITPAHHQDWVKRNPDAPNLLMTLFDVWVFKGKPWADCKVASWVPVDHLPAPIDVVKWCAQSFVSPIAMSKFGKKMLENQDVECFYIPHAIESSFKPTYEIKVSDSEDVTGREFIGVDENKFVVGMNAANKGVAPMRKAYGENIVAFSIFAQKHDDVVLYLHTDPTGGGQGINLPELLKAVGLKPHQYKFVDPYLYRSALPIEVVAATYTAMDVFLGVSMGEGFGVPTIEAQACGTRVIVSDFAASSELVGEGWLVEGQPYYDAPQKAFFTTPMISSIVDALEKAYQKGRSRSQQAMDFAKLYDADLVFENDWKPTLNKILFG
jgi:glycosyltransferase involved in cell wall biosynthesis